MHTPNRKRRQNTLFIVDAMLLFASIALALLFRNEKLLRLSNVILHIKYFFPLILFWLSFMYVVELYNIDNNFSYFKQVSLLFYTSVAGFFFTSTYFYFLPLRNTLPKTILVIYCMVAFFLLAIWRRIYYTFVSKVYHKLKVIFIGYNKSVEYLISSRDESYLKYDVEAIFTQKPIQLSDTTILRTIYELKEYLKTHDDYTLVIDQVSHSDELYSFIFSNYNEDFSLYTLDEFYEEALRQIPIRNLNLNLSITNIDFTKKKKKSQKKKGIYLVIKRIIDIVFSFFALIILLPVGLLVAILIKCTSKGPVLFRQKRMGQYGKIFTIIKFRTMSVEGNDHSMTTINDSRITKIGKVLRKIRLDEIPQFVNILKGDMSFVGPRPDYIDFAEYLKDSIPMYQFRYTVKPGITGWDQVSGKYHSSSIEDTIDKLQYDLYYIKNLSFFLDTSIFSKTIMTVLRMQGR